MNMHQKEHIAPNKLSAKSRTAEVADPDLSTQQSDADPGAKAESMQEAETVLGVSGVFLPILLCLLPSMGAC